MGLSKREASMFWVKIIGRNLWPLMQYLGALKSRAVYTQGPHDAKVKLGSGGIRTHASEETGALNQRLRPLGHATRYGGSSNSNQFAFHYS